MYLLTSSSGVMMLSVALAGLFIRAGLKLRMTADEESVIQSKALEKVYRKNVSV